MTQLCHSFYEQINQLSQNFKPEIALILGSGLGTIADKIKNPIIIFRSNDSIA